MGISRDGRHKLRLTGGKKKIHKKKRKYELGRPPSNTKLGSRQVHVVRGRGRNYKYRAIKLDSGSFSWPAFGISKMTRIIDVVYNASNNELVRTKTLVKNCIVLIDSHPFTAWYENTFGVTLGKKKKSKEEEGKEEENNEEQKEENNEDKDEKDKKSYSVIKKIGKAKQIDPALLEQFKQGRVLACISSRPGQCGKADGYIIEGDELLFYKRKMDKKKRN
ncbi:ribosomal protein S8.e, variant [Plasmodium yoelii 17X]|uniref:40S ribosomal protein S8 n=5 Tax=Plasmodium yoelii TaxID=5861 RepID=A0AAF0B381_PLAYO|nr:ribosomal protein S8e [Plasmodium yoelii]EAA21042.1 Ribosomal protein S8e, putative [Plasmodium yoelii yoelii]ETB59456.1 ribosomal protein S8.e, variant [Plasmodium yoelii 17X]WBY58153.1 40S ribosomal protein S8e [Plasmodium yoelii yoelii]CDU85193.1 40S ribosomal protein S8e, putative [Plasmodium yoelii]VTZ79088.1 40S ribosomal protein S8e, putative [Plasmodium yoelii]|eukprot:XP_729477.1 ribosomal protein S8e [Plasmodium yoelii]